MIKNLIVVILYPFSLIYGMVMIIRNCLFDYGLLKERTFSIPIIAVGNITVGGTGKTPQVEYLIELLESQGFKVGVLSRGYGRKTKGFVLADTASVATEIGDEPRQLKTKYPQIILAVDENRSRGIDTLLAGAEVPDVIVLDDAFQHRSVKPGLSILLVDCNRPLYKDFTFPAGRLREPAYGRKRADLVVLTKWSPKLTMNEELELEFRLKFPQEKVFFSFFEYQPLRGLWNKELDENFSSKPNILLVTGIASPRLIEEYFRDEDLPVSSLVFPDHHSFFTADYALIESTFHALDSANKIIVTTEKDGVRWRDDINFPESLKNKVFVLPLTLYFLEKEDKFNEIILDYVRKNKRNS